MPPMNDDPKRLLHDRLALEGLLQKNWANLVLAACDSRLRLLRAGCEGLRVMKRPQRRLQ